jgi:hypothetical protein
MKNQIAAIEKHKETRDMIDCKVQQESSQRHS